MDEFNLSPTKLNEIQNHDDFIIICKSSDPIPMKLKEDCDDYLREYNSDDICIDEIKKFKSERKFFLILTNIESLSKFEEFVRIQFIYILNEKHENIKFNKEDHPKLVDIFKNIDELTNRLRKDLILTYRSDLPISISSLSEIKIEQTLMNLHGNTLMFLWIQVFIYYLVKSNDIDINKLKENMLKQCRLECENNKTQLNEVNNFYKNCSDNNVLQWYTKDTFLFRLLNKACRTQNTELICKFRYFIILLYKKFQDLSKEQQIKPSTVYRGQMVDKNTLEKLKLNVGHCISINTIFSTSRREEVARMFINDRVDSVIFTIKLPNQISNSFIDISNYSSIKDEEEILFFLGTVFLLDSIEQEQDTKIWLINLTLKNEISNDIENLINIFQLYMNYSPLQYSLFMQTDDFNMIEKYYFMLTKKRFSLNNDPIVMLYIHLAFTFSNLGLYEKAVQLYKEALSKGMFSIDSPQFKVLHIIIGYLYYHLSDYDNAFLHYGIGLSLLDETNLLICELYSHIGDVQKRMNNIDIALSYYIEALKIVQDQDIPSLPNIYENIVDILKIQNNFHDAFAYEEQAREIDLNQYHIPSSTPDNQELLEKYQNQLNNEHNLTSIQRIELLYKIGLRLEKKGDFNQALKKLLEANELIIKNPPSWEHFPRLLSTLYDNIALLQLFFKNYLEALTMWKKAIDIRTNYACY